MFLLLTFGAYPIKLNMVSDDVVVRSLFCRDIGIKFHVDIDNTLAFDADEQENV